jgi:hypothetical protein
VKIKDIKQGIEDLFQEKELDQIICSFLIVEKAGKFLQQHNVEGDTERNFEENVMRIIQDTAPHAVLVVFPEYIGDYPWVLRRVKCVYASRIGAHDGEIVLIGEVEYTTDCSYKFTWREAEWDGEEWLFESINDGFKFAVSPIRDGMDLEEKIENLLVRIEREETAYESAQLLHELFDLSPEERKELLETADYMYRSPGAERFAELVEQRQNRAR